MLSLNCRAVRAALGTNLLAGPLLAQGRSVAPVGFTGRVFLNEKCGNRMHTYLADAWGARVTSHIKALLAANIAKPDHAKATTDEIAKASPAYQLPPLLTLGLSCALQS
jgi:hypothetical protein